MNKNFVSIADDFIQKRMHVACDYGEFSLDSVCFLTIYQQVKFKITLE